MDVQNLSRDSGTIGVKKTSPDWYLLTMADMKYLFPNARYYKEKWFGMTKAIMAIKKPHSLTSCDAHSSAD